MFHKKYAKALSGRTGLSSAILLAALMLVADASLFSFSFAGCQENPGVCPYRDPTPRNSGGGGGSYGGGGNNNAAAALGVAGAALGLLGAIMENVERDQQELEQAQEQRNQAARAQQSARNRYCHQNFEKATAIYRLAGVLAAFSPDKALRSFNDAIDIYALCGESRAIQQTRAQITRVRAYIAKSEEESRRSEAEAKKWKEEEEIDRIDRERAVQGSREREKAARKEAEEYASRFGNDDNYWRYQNGQASNQTAQPAPDSDINSLAGLSRTQKLKILGERFDKIVKMPDGPQKDAAKKKHHAMLVAVINADKPGAQTGAVGAGPRTCANVDGKWVCSNDYNDPVFKLSPGGEQK